MASLRKITLPSGKPVWQARYYDQEHRQHAKNFARKVDGRQWLDEHTAARWSGAEVDPRKSRRTVAVEAQAWLDAHTDWKASTRVRNEGVVRTHVLPRWGKVQLGQVTTEAVQTWVTGMAGSPGTVRKNVGALSSILDHAVTMRRLGANPVKGVVLPRQVKKQRRYLSDAEVDALVGAAGRHGFEVQVLAYTGLRFGEFAALKVGNVDLGRRRIQVEASVTEVNGTMEWSDPKDYERRSVPYPGFLDTGMAAQVEGRGREEVLFPGRGGNAVREGNARRDWFDRAVEHSGIGYLTPHELRHTAASLAIRSGASVLAVQRMLGHNKPSTTLDVYSDLFDADLDVVMDKVTEARTEALKDISRTRGRRRRRRRPQPIRS